MTKTFEELVELLNDPEEPASKEELLGIVSTMYKLREVVYWQMFTADMGSKCHAFIEFCGLMGEFINMCRDSAMEGIDFTHANKHGGRPIKMQVHQAEYLADKFDCIFGPSLRANPEAARAFLRKLHLEEALAGKGRR